MLGSANPTVVDCVVCELSLAEDAGGAPENQNKVAHLGFKIAFLFFSYSLLVVARILRLDLLVREHTTPAPLLKESTIGNRISSFCCTLGNFSWGQLP